MTTLRARSLASGSSGNALLIEAGGTLIAVDCGLGARGLKTAIGLTGRSLAELDLVLVTHEHSDHASGLEAVVPLGVPVVCTAGTARAAKLPGSAWIEASSASPVSFGALEIVTLPVVHDANEPAGYRIAVAGRSITVLTDLGTPDDALIDPIADADLVVLEANHDADLLRRGPYPAHLKRRVLSDSGHLSNADCAELLLAACRRRAKPRTVWLAHLSQTNNRPPLALRTVEQRLAHANLAVPLAALPRRSLGPTWDADHVRMAATQLVMPGI